MFQCLINNYESGVVNYDERARDIAANGYQLYITQILNIQDSLEKENKKMELQQIINDKEIVLTVITLENYFITWSIVFTIRR
jgi:hypothetical protein